MRTPEETAALIATMMTRQAAKRARISTKSLKILSGRQALTPSFLVRLCIDLTEHNIALIDLQTCGGGWGLMQISSLTAARPLTPAQVFTKEELEVIQQDGKD